jgi:exopolysaccharide biosynthesis polyprenyl glycosylphosphotransferase
VTAQDAEAISAGTAELVRPPRQRWAPSRPFGSLFGRLTATELASFREGAHSRETLRRDARFRRALAIADVLASVAVIVLVVAVRGTQPEPGVVVLLPLAVALAKVAGLYDRDDTLLRKSTLDELPILFQVATVYALLFWFLQDALVAGPLSRLDVLAVWLCMFGGLTALRACARRIVVRRTSSERCLVLGEPAAAEQLAGKMRTSPLINAEIVGYIPLGGRAAPPLRAVASNGLPLLGSVSNLPVALWEHRIDRVVIDLSTTPTGDRLLDKVRLIKAVGVKVSLLPRMLEVVGWSVTLDEVQGMPLLGVNGYGLTRSSRFLKRALDVAGSLTALILLAPLFLLIAAGVRFTSRGPVLFRQRRVGRNGRLFDLLKFRTMYEGSDDRKHELLGSNEADGLFKIADDPRVTRFGKALRALSLDELPQFWNVLRGEMSLVGPRPLVPEEDSRIQGWLRRRLDVMPGMTGMWQVLGSARIPLHEMVKLDYLYRANWSLWLDLKILLRTVPFVLARRGL